MENQKKELLLRAEAIKKQVEADLAKLKVGAQESMNLERGRLESKLNEVSATIKEAEENFTEAVAGKINSWLK